MKTFIIAAVTAMLFARSARASETCVEIVSQGSCTDFAGSNDGGGGSGSTGGGGGALSTDLSITETPIASGSFSAPAPVLPSGACQCQVEDGEGGCLYFPGC